MKVLKGIFFGASVLIAGQLSAAENIISLKVEATPLDFASTKSSCQAIANWCHTYPEQDELKVNLKSVKFDTAFDMEKHDFLEVHEPVRMTVLVEGLFN